MGIPLGHAHSPCETLPYCLLAINNLSAPEALPAFLAATSSRCSVLLLITRNDLDLIENFREVDLGGIL